MQTQTQTLAVQTTLRLPQLKAGDPLGLGRARPPAPADPDTHVLLPAAARLTIVQVRRLLLEHTTKSGAEAELYIDAEQLWDVNVAIDYKIFIAGDSIYTRAELYDLHAFHEFDVQPETIFAQQEVGVFPPRAGYRDDVHVARDVGSEGWGGHPATTERGSGAPITPRSIVPTKIFIGKEAWEDFVALTRTFRGAARIARAQQIAGGAPAGLLGALLGTLPATAAICTAPALCAPALAPEPTPEEAAMAALVEAAAVFEAAASC